MKDRPVTEVEKHLDESVKQEIETLRDCFTRASEAAEESPAIGELDTYLNRNIDDIVAHLKRARQWEHKLESHQQGLLNHQQLIEQAEDNKYDIEAQLNRTEQYLQSTTETLENLRDQLDSESELHTEIINLLDELERQQQQLSDMDETLTSVDNEMMDSGVTWMD